MLYKTVTSLKQGQKQAFFLTLDMLIVVVSYVFSVVLFMGPTALSGNLVAASNDLFAMMCVAAALATYFGLHKVKLKSYEMQGMLSSGWVALAITASGIAFSLLDTSVAATTGTTATPASRAQRSSDRQNGRRKYAVSSRGGPDTIAMTHCECSTPSRIAASSRFGIFTSSHTHSPRCMSSL